MRDHVPTSAIPILMDPPFVLWLTLLSAAMGWRLLLALRTPVETTTPLERGLLAAALGFGLLQWLPYLLGMAGHLTPLAVWFGLLALTAFFARDMARVAGGTWRAARQPRAPLPNWIGIGALILAIPLTLAFLQALCPPTDPDGVGYHLTAAKRWLQAGDLHYLPTLLHTNAPMGVEMLFTLALAVWSDTAPKLIHYTLGILALLALFALGRRLHGAVVGFAAAALFLRMVPKENPLCFFTWAHVDLGLVLEVACAALAWLLWSRQRARGWWVCAALCAGFAASFKMTGVFVGLSLGVLMAVKEARVESRESRVESRESRVRFLSTRFLLLSLLPVLPWLCRTWIQTGNPVYPVLFGVFPTRDWDSQAAGVFDTWFKYYGYDWEPGVSWNLSQRQVARALGMAGVVLPAAALIWRWRDREARLLVLMTSLLTLFGIATIGLSIRLLLPEIALACVLLSLALGDILARRRWAQGLLLLLLAVNSAVYLRKSFPGVRVATATAFGLLPHDAYLMRHAPMGPLWSYVNVRLPLDGPVLVAALNASHGPGGGMQFYCDRECYTTDAYLQRRFHLDSWEAFLNDVRAHRIAYLVVASREADARIRHRRIGPDYLPARNEMPFARQLQDQYGRLLFAAGDFQLYRLDITH